MNEWLDNILLNYVTFVSLFSPLQSITAATIILGRIDRNILCQIAGKLRRDTRWSCWWLSGWELAADGSRAECGCPDRHRRYCVTGTGMADAYPWCQRGAQ